VRQFLWLALLSTPTHYGGPSLWRLFAMADPQWNFECMQDETVNFFYLLSNKAKVHKNIIMVKSDLQLNLKIIMN